MPTIFRKRGFRFFFFSNEPDEPIHVHVEKDDSYGKFWIDPFEEVYSSGFKRQELKQIMEIIQQNKQLIIDRWYEHFDQ